MLIANFVNKLLHLKKLLLLNIHRLRNSTAQRKNDCQVKCYKTLTIFLQKVLESVGEVSVWWLVIA